MASLHHRCYSYGWYGHCVWRTSYCIQMGYVLQKLAYLVGVVFAVVIIFQYFEFPYGDVISSLFSASKIKITETGSYPPEKSYPLPQILGDTPHTEPTDVHVKGIGTTYNGHDVHIRKDKRKKELDDSVVLRGNGVSGNQVVGNKNLTLEKIEQINGLEASTRGVVSLANVSSVIEVSRKKRKGKVVSISEMYDILVHNRASSHSMKPRWSSRVDQQLLGAKLQIENAQFNEDDHNLYPSVFRNISVFRRSYELMEKTLKVYIYKEGDKPIFNQPEAVLKGIYASEGWFMLEMKASKRFVTRKPKEAHLFYIPYSSKMLKATLSPNSHDRESVVPYLKNYLDMIAGRYGFWNRTGGADHFLVACHDWGADETRQFMGTCIRAICNTDVEKAGFQLGKDASLPETNVRHPENPLRDLGGKPPSKRSVLAFFAGKMHGYLRPILLRHWENKDPDMKIFKKLPKMKDDKNYVEYMKSSKFCICAKGSEVNSPRVVEAIFYECVPVLISDNFVPPFFEVLDWESFAVFVQEKDIPNLKNILAAIPKKRYLQMHERVKQVQQHFIWHSKPVKYDIFHMILHSIWFNRVFRVNP
ncbi:hypothetical protein L6452_29129 [Arctium lappa]|uniref:Uncharacterized protein n=1 Tax=Arctium lappa TaxID=4217 RepID=A0ACB8ZGD5_ARCLA|nr:hypothetical protein L6452_29129 [Arctium lappa]